MEEKYGHIQEPQLRLVKINLLFSAVVHNPFGPDLPKRCLAVANKTGGGGDMRGFAIGCVHPRDLRRRNLHLLAQDDPRTGDDPC